jgi:hypothetical protein
MQHSGGSFVNLVASIETETNNNNISPYNNKKEVFLKQIHFFLLCDSCFWCASYVCHNSSSIMSISKCPSCYNKKIKWMPMPSTLQTLANHIIKVSYQKQEQHLSKEKSRMHE